VTPESDNSLDLTGLAREHGARLRRFLAARLRRARADVPDLVQEVYLRLLRVPSAQTIRDPRAYLYTVALHVLHQHTLALSARPASERAENILAELESRSGDNPEVKVEALEDLERFDRILDELPPLLKTVFVLHRQYGYSREEIAAQLGLTVFAVKKYFAQALAHCRRRLHEME
jgi:RNA polymerase sigma factor (sigma-70 family)